MKVEGLDILVNDGALVGRQTSCTLLLQLRRRGDSRICQDDFAAGKIGIQ